MPAVKARVITEQEGPVELPEAKRVKKAEAPKPIAVDPEDPVQEKIAFLSDRLKEAEFEIAGPHANREMLLAMVPAVLDTPRDVRNSYQQTMANMISEVFGAEEAKLQQCLAEAQAKLDSEDAELAPFHSAAAEAKAAVQAKKEDIKMKAEALTKAEEVLQDSEAEVTAAAAERSNAGTAQEALTTDKEKFLEVQQGSYEVMRDGSWEAPKDQKRHLAALKPFFGKIGVEKSVLSSLPAALGKKPAERGEFDAMVMQQLEEAVSSGLSSLEEKLVNATAEVAERSEVETGSKAIFELAMEKKQVATEAVATAKEELIGLETALKDAQQATKDRKKLGKGIAGDRSLANSHFVFFKSEVQTRLNFLLERSSDAAPAEEQA